MSCKSCSIGLEGEFELPLLLRLPPEDLTFVTAFVRASGSLKAMAKLTGASYPTIRNRLDNIISQLDTLDRGVQQRRHEILDALENGLISATAAEEQLRKVGL